MLLMKFFDNCFPKTFNTLPQATAAAASDIAVSVTGRSGNVGIKFSGFTLPDSCVKPNDAPKNVAGDASIFPDNSLLKYIVKKIKFC